VYERVISSIVGGDEAVALLIVEPLGRSLGHVLEPAFLSLEIAPIRLRQQYTRVDIRLGQNPHTTIGT
jgi:hypothetical protein